MASKNATTTNVVVTAAETVAKKKRGTVRVVASVLVTNAEGQWTRLNFFELVYKEFSFNAGLKKALSGAKRERMTMTDENTVEVLGPVLASGPTKTVYGVLRYSGQCPECGAMPTKPNAWCELCMSQNAASNSEFDAEKALDALLGVSVSEDDDEDDE